MPILGDCANHNHAYPNFIPTASQFQLHTDTSAICLGAVLEQCGEVIAYASKTLTQAEKN